jgi:ABC-type dipeptide/oligopeptide/nickel transport system permease subunit
VAPFERRDLAAALNEAASVKGESLWHDAWRRLNRGARWSLAFLALVAIGSLLAPLLPLPSPIALDLQDEPQPPSFEPASGPGWDAAAQRYFRDAWRPNPIDRALLSARAALFGSWQTGHWLGTDAKGRDLLARIVWGSRVSIQVALAATLCSLLIGVVYGALAGYVGGRVDNLMMRIVDVLYSVPFIFVVIFLITILNEYRTELAGPTASATSRAIPGRRPPSPVRTCRAWTGRCGSRRCARARAVGPRAGTRASSAGSSRARGPCSASSPGTASRASPRATCARPSTNTRSARRASAARASGGAVSSSAASGPTWTLDAGGELRAVAPDRDRR